MIKETIETIQKLFDSDETTYAIAKATGLSTQFIDGYRNGEREIIKMSMEKAEILESYQVKKEETKVERLANELIENGVRIVSKSDDEDFDVFGNWPQIFEFIGFYEGEGTTLNNCVKVADDDELYIAVDKADLDTKCMTYVDVDIPSGTSALRFDLNKRIDVWVSGLAPERDFDDLEMTDNWFSEHPEYVKEYILDASEDDFRIDIK